jgi:hypothetical protein
MHLQVFGRSSFKRHCVPARLGNQLRDEACICGFVWLEPKEIFQGVSSTRGSGLNMAVGAERVANNGVMYDQPYIGSEQKYQMKRKRCCQNGDRHTSQNLQGFSRLSLSSPCSQISTSHCRIVVDLVPSAAIDVVLPGPRAGCGKPCPSLMLLQAGTAAPTSSP